MKMIDVLLFVACLGACSSESASPTSGSNPQGGSSALGAPSRLSAEPMGSGIHLVWNDNSSSETGFEVERKDVGGFVRVASVPFDTNSYHDVGVAAGKSYVYRVRAIGDRATSDYSNEANATASALVAPGAVDAGSIDTTVANPTFQKDIVPLLQISCGTASSSCHIRDMYAATKDQSCRGWLALEDAMLGSKIYGGPNDGRATGCPDRSLYDRLTQLDAWEEPNGALRRYVKPGDPAGSYLYNKLTGGPFGEKSPGVLSDPMPSSAPLPQAQIDLVKRWIEQGAPR